MTDISALEAYAGQLSEAAARANAASEKQHVYIHGSDQTDVATESGPVPSIAKQARLSWESTAGLRLELASDVGAELVKLDGRSLADTIRDTVNIKDGKYGAIGDGVYHPLSERYPNLTVAQVKYPFVTSLAQSIDWAAIQKALNVAAGRTVHGPKGGYVLTDGLVIKSNTKLVGEGGTTPFYQGFPMVSVASDGGFDMYMIGTGPKTKEIYGVTDMQPSGGVRVDPTTGLSYAMANFYNTDATAAASATARKVSVGIDASNANGITLKNFRIIPAFPDANGIIHGYNDGANLNWANDWGIGVLLKDAHDCVVEGVRAVGHWREAGLGIIATLDQDPNGLNSSCERNKIINGQFSGHKGIMVRGGDVYKITAVGANTISAPWHDSTPFPAAGGNLLISFGGATAASYTYASWSKVGDKMVFAGMSPNPVDFGVTTSSALLAGNSFGLQGTEIRGNYITGLEHASGRRCTDPALVAPFANPSKCLEVSGVPAANLRVITNTIMTQEDCFAHFHNASNMHFSLNYWESKAAVGIAGKGARFVSIGSYLNASYVPYMYGTVHTVTFNDQMADQADMYPALARSPLVTRFGVDAGLFDLKTMSSTERHTDISDENNYIIQGLRGETLKFMDGDGAHLFSMGNTGNFSMGKRARFNTLTEDRYQFYRLDGTTVIMSLDGSVTTPVVTIDGNVVPLAPNTRLVGTAIKPFSGGNTQTAYNITSDQNYKTDIVSVHDAALDAWESVSYAQYRLVDAVEKKGDAARQHIGLVAQQVKSAFEAAGIDPFEYGLLCYDEWDEQPEILGDYGNVEHHHVAAGQRYSIRYEEALALEAAMNRRKLARLEERLMALEALG